MDLLGIHRPRAGQLHLRIWLPVPVQCAYPIKDIATRLPGIQIDQGKHGDTPLDGLKIGADFQMAWCNTRRKWRGFGLLSMSGLAKSSATRLLKIMTGPGHRPVRHHVRCLCFNHKQNA